MAMNDDNTPPALFPLWTTITIFVVVLVIGIFSNFNSALNLWASQINSKTLEFYKALGTVLVAIIAAGIAGGIQYRQWQTANKQWRTAQQKLNLDLFDRRFKIYRAAMDLGYDLNDTKDESTMLLDYGSIIDAAEWLFNENISKYIGVRYIKLMTSKVHERNEAIKLTCPESEDPESFEHSVKINQEYWAWYAKERTAIKTMFRPYLKLDQT